MKGSRMRKAEQDALLEEFAQSVLRAMDRARLLGLPARLVQTTTEEAAVNWHAPVPPKTKPDPNAVAYLVTLRAPPRTVDVRMRAVSPEAAVFSATQACPGLTPETVEDVGEEEEFEVVGRCESCLIALIVGRDEGRSVDEDGTLLCVKCCQEAEKEPQ